MNGVVAQNLEGNAIAEEAVEYNVHGDGDDDVFDDPPEAVGDPTTGQPEVLLMMYTGGIVSGKTYKAPGLEWAFCNVSEIGRGRRLRHVVAWERVL